MKKTTTVIIVLALTILIPSAWAASMQADKAVSKLARGTTNMASCWGEYITQYPAAVEKSPDHLTAAIYGVFRGTAYTIRRAMVGLYDVVTSPSPGRTNYGPVIQPETIFNKTAETLSH